MNDEELCYKEGFEKVAEFKKDTFVFTTSKGGIAGIVDRKTK